jgi:cyclophilin family peptidyl-prolyl cis-trans isomerase
MKKTIILSFLALSLVGCANQVPTSEVGVGIGQEETNNQAADKTLSAQEQKTMSNETTKQDPNKPNPNLFEDLYKEYKGAVVKTNLGDIEVEFYSSESPFTVNNFLNLAKIGFYDNTSFHRIIKDFMIQGGDPNSKDDDWGNDGRGGPGYRFGDEFNSHPLVRGSLAMANSGPDTNGSQFFIVTAESTPWLDGKHTNFGKVLKGMDVVEKLEGLAVNENDHPTSEAFIKGIELKK